MTRKVADERAHPTLAMVGAPSQSGEIDSPTAGQ